MECCGQLVEIFGAPVGQGVVHLVPDSFVGVELRRISWEPLQLESTETAAVLADGLPFVRLTGVPDHHDVAS